MLITLLAAIGLFFVIMSVYRKGKKDGIQDAVDYFVTEMKKRKIDTEVIIAGENFEKMNKSKKLIEFSFLNWEKSK